MTIFELLDFISDKSEEEKEEILKEEYNRQKRYVDALCNIKRETTNND